MTGALDTRAWRKMDAAHYMHPFTDGKELGENARIIVRSEGVYIYDSEGRKILDGMSGLWCVGLGYGQSRIVDAVQRQMEELPYYNSFFQCATPPAVELAGALADVSPDGFRRAFFTGSGSEANDTAVRMLRRYWQLRGQPEKFVIISRRNAYHGSTMAAASLGGMAAMHEQGGPPIPGVHHVAQPYAFEDGRGMDPDEFGRRTARAIEDAIREIGADKVAGFIGEPVQGAGGVIVPPDSYWPEVQRICDAHSVPIISDEVICGFGRLGRWFGAQRFGVRPKIITIAKGLTSGYLPMGGALVSDDIADVIVSQGGEFAHGFTYSGHPACAAAALETLRIMRESDIVDRVREETAPYFQRQWASLGDHPLVGEARSDGLMAAIELVADKASLARFDKGRNAGVVCREASIECGLVMRAVRDSMIVAPPLVITRAEIDELVAKAREALNKAAKILL